MLSLYQYLISLYLQVPIAVVPAVWNPCNHMDKPEVR